MKEEIVTKLLTLNQNFYDGQAASFAHSRTQPQPGFTRLLPHLPKPCTKVLDVGCGEGRFGRFLQTHHPLKQYIGIDFSAELLKIAHSQVRSDDSRHSQVCSDDFSRPSQVRRDDFSQPVRSDDFSRPSPANTGPINFYQRDITQPGFLADFGHFDLIACLATLHHIPGQANRIQLVEEMARHLGQNGRLIFSTWQFLDSQRQQRKLRDWSEIGLNAADVEPDDYLLTWQRGGFSYRYACTIDAAATAELAHASKLQIIHQFRSDGKEGDLSLYTILAKEKNDTIYPS